MPKITQSKKQYETPQVIAAQLATPMYGETAPTMQDVIKSANARGQTRHEMKNTEVADIDNLPDSAAMVNNEMVGVKQNGYLAKKGLVFGVNAFYNSLAPGMDIEDQENCDIRQMKMNVYEGGMGFPGDGWTDRTPGSQFSNDKDIGRGPLVSHVGTSKI